MLQTLEDHTIITGPPKSGKSWLALQLALELSAENKLMFCGYHTDIFRLKERVDALADHPDVDFPINFDCVFILQKPNHASTFEAVLNEKVEDTIAELGKMDILVVDGVSDVQRLGVTNEQMIRIFDTLASKYGFKLLLVLQDFEIEEFMSADVGGAWASNTVISIKDASTTVESSTGLKLDRTFDSPLWRENDTVS